MAQEHASWQKTKKMSYLDNGGVFDAVSHDILLIKFRKYVSEEAVITDVRNSSEKIIVTTDSPAQRKDG